MESKLKFFLLVSVLCLPTLYVRAMPCYMNQYSADGNCTICREFCGLDVNCLRNCHSFYDFRMSTTEVAAKTTHSPDVYDSQISTTDVAAKATRAVQLRKILSKPPQCISLPVVILIVIITMFFTSISSAAVSTYIINYQYNLRLINRHDVRRRIRRALDTLCRRLPGRGRIFQCTLNQDEISVRCIKDLEIPGRGVIGVARDEGQIFVLRRECNTVLVYMDQKPYSKIKEKTIDGMIDPSDILAHDNNTLYITDNMYNNSDGCLWCFSSETDEPAQQIDLIPQWRGKLQTISRGNDGCILITTTAGLYSFRPTGTGDRWQEITFPLNHQEMKPKTEHIVPMGRPRENSYVLCYTAEAENKSYICKLQIQLSGLSPSVVLYGEPRRMDEFNQPQHLAVTPSGVILVADSHNDRVVILGDEMEMKYELINRDFDRIELPRRLLYFENNRKPRLLVALHHNIRIYSIDPNSLMLVR